MDQNVVQTCVRGCYQYVPVGQNVVQRKVITVLIVLHHANNATLSHLQCWRLANM